MKVVVPATVVNIHLTEDDAMTLINELATVLGTEFGVAYKLFEQLVVTLDAVPEVVFA